jgi:hypothetical protein
MKKQLLAVVSMIALGFVTSQAQMTIGESTQVVLATVDEAKAILVCRDDFVERMSFFDRAARLKTDKVVTEAEYFEFVRKNVVEWSDGERQKFASAIEGIQPALEALSLPFPAKVLVIRTTGNEEGGAAYTRANAMVLPQSDLGAPLENLQSLLCHELFHILSRANPVLRDELYATIGFVKCDEVPFPGELQSRKITNPDAPRNDHCIRLQVDGKDGWAIPILYSSSEAYDVERGGQFFDYLQFQFLMVERSDSSPKVNPIHDGQKVKLVDPEKVSGFFEQVGKNTQYIIHPEEILADNFAILVLQPSDVPSPDIIERMRGLLKGNAIVEPGGTAGADQQHR